jgi:predicted ATPase
MAYEYSELDKKNLGWFLNDFTRATLTKIRVFGRLKSLKDLQVEFLYPITAIAGRNGSGKTTILALAACAYGNKSNGYKLPGRKNPYYKHSEFFVQTVEDAKLNVRVNFQFLHNRWRSKKPDEKVSAGWQSHDKLAGGRWSYSGRVVRTVVYLGIDRIVPDVEKSVSKSYRKHFQFVNTQGWENEVRDVVGRILGIEYKTFHYKSHTKYRLPVASTEDKTYSGFNMGAGEESLFELFSIIKEIPDGSLILIDEIELGLHEEAQSRLIHELKILCNERKLQIICTTHSPRILDSLPLEGRIFLEKIRNDVTAIPSISSTFASGKLSGNQNVELDILVEDDVAKMVVEACLDAEIRSRVKVLPIGSSVAVMRHLAARYKEQRHPEICAVLDGDQSTSRTKHIKAFLDAV